MHDELPDDKACQSGLTKTCQQDVMLFLQMAGRSLESELDIWKKHAHMFVQLAQQTVNSSSRQQSELHERVESARNTMTR